MPRASPFASPRARSRSSRRSPLSRSWAKSFSLPLSETQMVLAIGPEAARGEVGGVEFELAVLEAFAACEVVGVDAVLVPVAVLRHPDRRAVAPESGRLVTPGVERVDVAGDVPGEGGVARGGAGRRTAASAAASSATGEDDRRRLDRWLCRGGSDDPQDPVPATAVRGGHVQGAVGTEHRRAEPAVRAIEFGYDNLTHEGAVRGELEEPQPAVYERGHRQPSLPAAPLLALEEDAATGGKRRIARRPPGLDGVGELREVGHRDVLVVAGHRVPAVVAA